MTDPTTVRTSDGELLQAEIGRPDRDARAVCVLCHPHPQHGGSMRSLVISELFRALPGTGVTTLRFNFRGVESSTGAWGEGDGERLDVAAAVELATTLEPGRPLLLAGWSFGADMALSSVDAGVSGWFAIAPPLRHVSDTALATIASDDRPRLLALAEHDEVRPAGEVAAIASAWNTTEVVVVTGASHFFVGRTDRLVTLARGFVDRLVVRTP